MTTREALHRHPWRFATGSAALVLLVALLTAALRILLWEKVEIALLTAGRP